MPFQEHYRHIPHHMYDDMRAHIQEMLDISAIHQSHSPCQCSGPSLEKGWWPEVLHRTQEA